VIAYVLDASIAAKWFLPPLEEPLAGEAMELLRRHTKGELAFIVPDIFWVEFANVLWKAARQGRCSRRLAELALTQIMARNFPTTPSMALLEKAFTIAMGFNRTVYDSLYVALAVARNTHLVTGDERLANALAGYLPVKWLGAI
jgi:predicted nucleic acid-binding protein